MVIQDTVNKPVNDGQTEFTQPIPAFHAFIEITLYE